MKQNVFTSHPRQETDESVAMIVLKRGGIKGKLKSNIEAK
jgi:hypothetical protein